MRKETPNQSKGRRVWRWVAGASLAATLAAFGCSSNPYDNTLNGEPARATPRYAPTETPGVSNGTEGIPPMASSFVYSTAPAVNTDAIATLAADQGFQGRVLGPSGAEGPQTGSGLEPSGGQWVNPAVIVNPQSTVNATISSPATPVITGGTGGGAADLFTGAATIGQAAPLTVAGIAGVGALPPSGAVVPSTAAFSPTISGAQIYTPGAASGTIAGTSAAAPVAAAVTAPTVTTSPVPFTSMASSIATTGNAGTVVTGTARTQAVRIVTQANGPVMITNVKQ